MKKAAKHFHRWRVEYFDAINYFTIRCIASDNNPNSEGCNAYVTEVHVERLLNADSRRRRAICRRK